MKRLAFSGGVALLGVAALLANRGHAADHADSDTLTTSTAAMGDINDVYAWMSPDTTTDPAVGKINLAMTVSPADNNTLSFGPSVQYVFHILSKTGAPMDVVAKPANGVEYKVICTFVSNTNAQCWVTGPGGVKDYVTGDPSMTTGMTSTSGKLKVFAGRRSDPFFFNLQAFRTVSGAVSTAVNAGAVMTDAAGCVTEINPGTGFEPFAATAGQLRTQLMTAVTSGTAPCPTGPHSDCFATLNVKAIVVQVDKALVTSTGNVYSGVWGSTHATP